MGKGFIFKKSGRDFLLKVTKAHTTTQFEPEGQDEMRVFRRPHIFSFAFVNYRVELSSSSPEKAPSEPS